MGDGHDDARPGPAHEVTEGGDPVCWLEQVCDACGAMREDPKSAVCARCGTPFPTPDAPDPDAHRTPGAARSGD